MQDSQNIQNYKKFSEDLQNSINFSSSTEDLNVINIYSDDNETDLVCIIDQNGIRAKGYFDLSGGTFSNIVTLNSDAIEYIYAASQYKNNERRYLTEKVLTLLISGDNHGSVYSINNIVTFLNEVSIIDGGILLGDIVGSEYEDDSTYYTTAIANAKKPFLTVIGNHDTGQPSSEKYGMSDLYNKYISPNIAKAQLSGSEFIEGNTYYYKDFSNYSVRLIVLCQYDTPFGAGFTWGYSCYSQEQINWLITTLNSTPSDYHVIIAMHSVPSIMEVETCKFSATNHGVELKESGSNIGYATIIEDIVDAWINGTTLSKTYDRTPYGTKTIYDTLTATCDFTSRGTGIFVCYIGGHWHTSIVSHCKSHPTQKMYSVITSRATGYSTGADTARFGSTKALDGFVVMCVDTLNKHINLVSVGAKMSDDMVLRDVYQFNY